jgi:diguanylate cyclase (GGDEF)-like protein
VSPFGAALVAAAAVGPAGFLTGLAAMRRRVRGAAAAAAEARWLADHDALTGLPNRAAAHHHYQRQAAAGQPCAVALLDLDDFKAVNDTWGHQAGDVQLAAIADRLAAACRELGGVACRLGGDEFVLLLRPADPQTVMQQAATVLAKLGAALTLVLDDGLSVITRPAASAGVAVPEPGAAFSEMLRRADIALYHAKLGRTGPRLYSPGLRQPACHRHQAPRASPRLALSSEAFSEA